MHVNPVSLPSLSYDEWNAKLQLFGARYRADGIDRHAFSGWICARCICNLEAIELRCNAPQIRRTLQDARRDGANHYYVLLQRAGQMLMDQNGQQMMLNSGEVSLIEGFSETPLRGGQLAGCPAAQSSPFTIWRRRSLNWSQIGDDRT